MNPNELLRRIEEETEGTNNVIEFGCGQGIKLRYCKSKIKIGYDRFLPDILKGRESFKDDSNVLLINADLTDVIDSLRHESNLDVCLLCDVVEHFYKPYSMTLLEKCKRIFNKVILFIPIGNHPQGVGKDGNINQEHLSSWEYEDLEKLGFIVERWEDFHKEVGKDSRAAFCVYKRQ